MLTLNVLLLLGLVAASTLAWWVMRRRDGSFRSADRRATQDVDRGGEHPRAERLEPGDLGLQVPTWQAAVEAGLVGEVATFVQLSSEACATCPQVSRALADVVAEESGVRHVEIDAAEHLALVRRLGVLRTPTVLLLDARGVAASRTSGPMRADQARAALAALAALRAGEGADVGGAPAGAAR